MPKTPAKRTHSSKKKAAKSGRGRPTVTRPYPQVPLEEALQIPLKIKELNGGNPWATEDVAGAVDLSGKSSAFFYLTAGARDFGLTTGTRNTATIALTDLGRELVYAPDPETERGKKLEAFLGVDIFKQVLEHYKSSGLPEMKYLGNTLEREFKLAPQFHEEFSRLFRANADYLGLTEGLPILDGGGDTGSASGSPVTVTLGEPKSGEGLKAFVIMPFTERGGSHAPGFFTEVLRSLITPAGVDAGFKVETANRQGSDVIQSTIINDLLEADLVIADLTDHNPNVLFELGIRMAQANKPVALIKASGTGKIFDVDNLLRVFEYNANLWRTTLEKDLPELTRHIQASWDNRQNEMTYMRILRRGSEG